MRSYLPRVNAAALSSGSTADSRSCNNSVKDLVEFAIKFTNFPSLKRLCRSFKLNTASTAGVQGCLIIFLSQIRWISSRKKTSQLSIDFHLVKMWKKVFNFLFLLSVVNCADNNSRIVCYYDSRAFAREGKYRNNLLPRDLLSGTPNFRSHKLSPRLSQICFSVTSSTQYTRSTQNKFA